MRKPLVVLGSMAGSALLAVAGAGSAAAAGDPATAPALTWAVVHTPNRHAGNGLHAVSCVSADACTAVGAFTDRSGSGTLVQSWDGTRWSAVPSPNRTRTTNELLGVACVSPVACMAVGDSGFPIGGAAGRSSSGQKTLAESWNGSRWSVVPSPTPGTSGTFLSAVSCVSADVCMAVGASGNSSGNRSTLAESWNGTRWLVVPTPTPNPGGGFFRGVSCASKHACMAVGISGSTGVITTLAEVWNGRRWSVVPSPNPVAGNDEFNGVSCAAADACTAVGVDGNSSVTSTLIETWDGRRWSVVPSPNPGPGFTLLDGVSCAAAGACNAVGFYFTQAGADRTLIESWDGTHWSVVPHPQPGINARELVGVSCASQTTCTAAGSYFGHGTDRTLIETGTASA